MDQGFEGLLVDFWWCRLVQVFGLDQASVPVANVPVAWGCQYLLSIQVQPLAGAAKLLGGVLASMVLDGQQGVGDDLLRLDFRWEGGNKVVLGLHTNVDNGEVDLRRHLVSHRLGGDKPVLCIIDVFWTDDYGRHASPVDNRVASEDSAPGFNGDNRVGTIGLERWGLLQWSIGSIVILPFDRENGASHVIGANVG